ncbi:uncharacterized protein M6B38_156405 [Iris pallida]|uniref:Uncharacterized protein n=1 Tax=Iris pallida TaxID=29817 RepID=A0AAX6F202_IRIPA|nr:uncharacterized protein M6B38_107655 [Iris pallida]KAJ6810457.1 uncharacterized protein M6B38_156405 [Iris pallida]
MKPSFTFECQNIWRFDQRKEDQSSYVLQAAEAPAGEKGRYKIINNLKKISETSFDSLSVSKAPGSSMNWANFSTYHFQKTTRSNSERKHFPMFDINRRIETILGPLKRTGYGTMEVRMNGPKLDLGESSSSPHLIEFASEEHQLQQQRVAETKNQLMQKYDSVSGSSPHNYQAFMSTKDEEDNNLFSSKVVYKEHFANTNFSYLRQEMCNSSSHSTSMVHERKNDKQVLRTSGCSWTRLKDGSTSSPNDIPQTPLTGEDDTESENSYHSRSIKSNKLENCCNMGTVRTENASSYVNTRKGRSQKHADETHLLFTKKMSTNLLHEDQTVGESAASAKVKGASFFERLTSPASLHHIGQREENSVPMVGSTNTKCSNEIDANFMYKQIEPSARIDLVCTDIRPASSSPAVGTSSRSQKDIACYNTKLAEIDDSNLEATSSKDVSTSRSESMDVDNLSCTRKPSSSAEKDTDATWKWVKRLRSNTLDSIPIATKRLKLEDASPGVAEVVTCNRSISNPPQSQQLVESSVLPKKVQCCSVDSVMAIPWIQRWCRQSRATSAVPVLCAPEHSNVLPERLEAKQFPSLAAMALMGKSVNNFRPCEFQKRGATNVWNTGEF